MARKCPACGSATTSTGLADNSQCLECGALFNSEGDVVDVGMDQSTRDAIEARLEPRTTNIVGNLADLQRLGAREAPKETKASAAFELPPGVDADDVDAPKPAEKDAAKKNE